MIKSEIVADSLGKFGDRLTSFVVTFPRIILAEVNTHKMISKNSASSRAIPVEKMIERVLADPFIPEKFPYEHKGMQASKWIEQGTQEYEDLKQKWLLARDSAVNNAKELLTLHCSKQITNRLLEPFMWHTAILTGTHWDNFFALRAHTDAQYEFQCLAHKMLKDYNDSNPKYLEEGSWHIPFGDKFDDTRILDLPNNNLTLEQTKLKISVARVARISYHNFDGKDDYEADIKLHDRLLLNRPIHASPAEHIARAMFYSEYTSGYSRVENSHVTYGWSRNLKGFIPYRATIPQDTIENDPRVIKKVLDKH